MALPALNPSIPASPVELLQPRLDGALPNWVGVFRDRRAFRVRGFSWFWDTTGLNVAGLVTYLPKINGELLKRPGWKGLMFNWEGDLSPRQVYDASNRLPLLFHKAAQTTLLCELAFVDRGGKAEELYRRMRIESAVYRIADFTGSSIEQALAQREDVFNVLVRECGQESHKVFVDMANNMTVSYRLAEKVRKVLLGLKLAKFQVGGVVVGQDRKYRVTSKNETIEHASLPQASTQEVNPPRVEFEAFQQNHQDENSAANPTGPVSGNGTAPPIAKTSTTNLESIQPQVAPAPLQVDQPDSRPEDSTTAP